MADIEYWTGQSSDIEALIEYWTGQSSDIEAFRSRYVRTSVDIRSVLSSWFGLSANVAVRLFKWAKLSCNVEEALILNLWSGLSSNVEVEKDSWFGLSGIFQDYHEEYFGQSSFLQDVFDYYVGNLAEVESFKMLWNRVVLNSEVWKERYSIQSVNVEHYISRWCMLDYNFEVSVQKYAKCNMFVRPSVYIRPEFGEYDSSIEVEIEAELLPLSLKYGFGRNLSEYRGKFRVYRDRKLFVEVDYGDYKINKFGEYRIKQLEGKVVYSDYRDLVWIDEELLWKKY